jgi:rhodanese-related sulfurtransferase
MLARTTRRDSLMPTMVTVETFRELIESGTRLKCIDARDPVPSDGGSMKIPGSLRMPFASRTHLETLPRDRHLVVYGTGGDDTRVAAVAQFLVTRGFSAAYLFGGFEAWVAAGFPVMRD